MQTSAFKHYNLSGLKKTLLYIVLLLPLLPLTVTFINSPWNEETYEMLMHISGEFTARFLVIALLISPLRVLFPSNKFLLWMLKHRRNIGVASFAYAVIHTLIYLTYYADFSKYVQDIGEFTYLAGWIAMLIYLPLGITSNNYSVKKLGFHNWKWMQNWTYVAVIFVAIHWLLKPDGGTLGPVLFHFLPLLLLQLWRLYKQGRFNKQNNIVP